MGKISIREIYKTFIEADKEFEKFVKENEDKTIEEIALEFDIDVAILKSYL